MQVGQEAHQILPGKMESKRSSYFLLFYLSQTGVVHADLLWVHSAGTSTLECFYFYGRAVINGTAITSWQSCDTQKGEELSNCTEFLMETGLSMFLVLITWQKF